ncbi:hypothetical protein CAAU_2160 [Caloramator australicus RC3]|uniref:Uncharacterized protein n=1 Tax=Caloramator australicus RC3 TaxID=857293 RepID=I7KVX1_9CLOT|nr:hypothetical protein CAAU_2160 [Caloramator australicus RC3]
MRDAFLKSYHGALAKYKVHRRFVYNLEVANNLHPFILELKVFLYNDILI